MNISPPPSGILDPQQPWYNGKVGEITWNILKLKLTGGRGTDGTQYSSFVNLSNADADRLISNIKKYGKYPQVNQRGGAGGYENLETYQKWLVEEFLEKPFQKQTNQKIEDASIESRLKEIQEQRKQKAQSFISRPQSSFRPGKTISLKTTRMTGIVPKRSFPTGVSQSISPQESQESAVAPKAVSSSLGRLTLDLVQIGDNLDRIKDIIEEDYKQTKETNKKEIEDYRKRVANRGRKLPRKDLGDNKKELKDIIKPFVGGFFSGVGGAIRSLSAFNLIDALVRGDWGQVFKSFMGIGITFLPQIGAMVAGSVLKSLLKGFGKNMFGARAPRGSVGMARGPGIGMGKFGKMAALGTGALALGGAFAASQGDESGTESDNQTRLEELTAEQKGLTDKNIISITQNDLKKFQDLNKKFEKTLDILIEKSGPGIGTDLTNKSAQNVTPGSAPMDPNALGQATDAVKDPNVKAFLDTLANVESGGQYNVSVGGAKFSDMSKHPEMYNAELGSDAAGRYQFISTTFKPIAQRLGLNDFSPKSQDLAAVQYLKDLGVLDEIMTGDKAKIEDVIRRLKGSKWTGLKRYGSGQGFEYFQRRKQIYGTQSSVAPTPSRRNADEVSATPSNGRSIAVVPVPQLTGSDGSGSFNSNGSGDVASVDPSNRDDVYGRLYRTGWNVVDVG